MHDRHTENNNYGFLGWMMVLVVYSAFLYYLSSIVVEVPGPSFSFKDKIAHACAYGLLAFVAWQTFRRRVRDRHISWAWLYAALYGASDEWHQYYVPGRHPDVWDWLADVAGATLVLLLIKTVFTPRQKPWLGE